MKNLILVRHGESVGNADVDVYFQQDLYDQHIQLTELGRQQARECGEKLALILTQPYTLFVSPYQRAAETWEEIKSKLPHPPTTEIVDGRLREQEFKVFKDKQEYLEKRARRLARGKLYYRFKNAESGYDVLDRISGFYNQLRMDWQLKNREETVLIVCHEIVIRCFMMLLLDLHPERFESFWVKNCGFVVLEAGESLKFRHVGAEGVEEDTGSTVNS